MICLTKYVTVRVSKGEPNLYDGFWLARVSAVCLCGYVCVCTHTCALYGPRPCTDTRTDASQTLRQLQNWNFSINNNYHCQRADATSCSLPSPKWFSSVRLKCSIVKFNCKTTFVSWRTLLYIRGRYYGYVWFFKRSQARLRRCMFNFTQYSSRVIPRKMCITFECSPCKFLRCKPRTFYCPKLVGVLFILCANRSTTRWGWEFHDADESFIEGNFA